ncbi:MAG: hypothetical protein KIT09_07590 [Bryobacteraceae bacterium]|nr:hypothetical protein [Bryobacteraceae bacterium]
MNHLLAGRWLLAASLLVPLAVGAAGAVRVTPTPQYLEPGETALRIAPGGMARIVIGPAATESNDKLLLAAEFLRRRITVLDPSVKVVAGGGNGPSVHLWDYSADARVPAALNLLDRQTLTGADRYGQSYVIKPEANALWVIGGSDQGALLGAMTALQLLARAPSGIEIQTAYVRDYPHFQFRAASDWLLNVEINRWALDRGQGAEAFARECERKLDRALRFKINMVLMDGFGWGLEQRFEGYAELMRRLNRYARARGIYLYYGGYGASYGLAYQGGPLYEDAPYLGKIFENRESYPDGPKYQCMGFTYGDRGVDPSVLGSCRANEDLNRQKAEELRQFVAAVEPGALYIHHEDFGDFQGTEQIWQKRCARCRARWPSDALVAKDGGAGGFANGYAALVKAVNGVRNPASGYDASRDCEIILVSPVYVPDSPASEDWAETLELWQNIGLELPASRNLQVGFREVFPQKHGNAKFTKEFEAVMRRAGLNVGSFLFYAGGADNFQSDYPLTGTPSLNAMFLGARGVYNSTGDFYREPMEVVAAEYSWNARAPGWRDPMRFDEATALDRRYTYEPDEPKEVFGPDGVYARACQLLYGSKAGPIMASYYRESAYLPDVELTGRTKESGAGYLPGTWNRLNVLPSHWRHLALDSKTWGAEMNNEAYKRGFSRLKIDRPELHRRLARRWQLGAELNAKGAKYVERALAAGADSDAVEDLKFLKSLFDVYQPLTEGLAAYHAALRARFSGSTPSGSVNASLDAAAAKAQQAREAARRAFPRPLDPAGGEIGTLRRELDRLVESIGTARKAAGL